MHTHGQGAQAQGKGPPKQFAGDPKIGGGRGFGGPGGGGWGEGGILCDRKYLWSSRPLMSLSFLSFVLSAACAHVT